MKHTFPTFQLLALAILFGFSSPISSQKPTSILEAFSKPTNRPNIIYIYADDLGYGELGCYGQEKIKPPNLDRMAAEGMKFTQHYTGAPVCAPARCMLMTGKSSGHSYIRGNYELGGFPDSLEGGQIAVRVGNWKGIRTDVRKNPNAPWQIFNLKKDPFETTDLAATDPNWVLTLERIVKHEHQSAHVKDWEFINPRFR